MIIIRSFKNKALPHPFRRRFETVPTGEMISELPYSDLHHSRARSLEYKSTAVLFVILVLGFWFTLANTQLPIVRNSLIYARIAENLLEHDMRAWQVCGNPELSYMKACAFPLVSAPLVWLVGANAGLKWATFLATSGFLLACFWFFRRFNSLFNLGSHNVWLEIMIVFFNPLLIHQFWSGYSDPLFALLFLLSFILLDVVLNDSKLNGVGWSIAYATVLLLALLTKHHGLLLFVLHPLYVYRRRDLLVERLRRGDRQLLCLAIGFCLVIGFVAWEVLGYNPLLNLRSNSGQYSQPIFYLVNIKQFLMFLMLTFGALLITVPKTYISTNDVELALVIVLYAHVMMVYQGAAYNMRYYIPILPLMALYIMRGLDHFRSSWLKPAVLSVFLLTNVLTILFFNHQGSNAALRRQLPQSPIKGERYLDNLRLTDQMAIASSFQKINRAVPRNGMLYWVSDYAGDASYYTFQRSHLLRNDIKIAYSASLENIEPHQHDFLVFSYDADPAALRKAALEARFKGAQVTVLGEDLYHVSLHGGAAY